MLGADEPAHGLADSTQHAARRLPTDKEAALATLYARITPAIHVYAALRVGPRWVGPEDIVAETWLRVAAHLADYDGNRSFRAWVFGFAQKVVQEAQRRIARLPAGGDASASGSSAALANVPDSITSAHSRAARLEEIDSFLAWARSDLSDYEREVLLLRGVQGRKLDDVATVLGRTPRAVTVCWARLLEKIEARRVPADVIDPE